MANKMLDRRFILVSASALTLSACGNLLGPPDTPQVMYPLTGAAPAPMPQAAPVTWALSIDIPDAADSLDTQRIGLLKPDGTLDYYANSAWPDRLPLLVQTALLAAFQASGRLPSVARSQDALHADYEMTVEIRDFTAHYSQPDAPPSATIVLVAQMATAHGRKIVANFTATQTAAASANSTPAAVQAFNAALGAAVGQIVPWALALPAPAAS